MLFIDDDDITPPKNRPELERLLALTLKRPSCTLHEHEVYEFLAVAGIAVPAWHFHTLQEPAAELRKALPHAVSFVAKAVVEGVSHKTETGGIIFNVTHEKAIEAADQLKIKFGRKLSGILFVEQIKHEAGLGSEILFGMYQDPFFGPCINFGFGGTSTEYCKEIMRPQMANVIIPAAVELNSVEHVLRTLPVCRFIEGRARGSKQQLSYEKILETLLILQNIGRYYSAANPKAPFVIEELEINPAAVHDGRVVVLDGVLSARKNDKPHTVKAPIAKIGNLLNPGSVAIAGASGKNPANPSNAILKKFLKGNGPRDQIYVIHPKEDSIEGVPCTKDLATLIKARNGKPVDCLIIGVPAKIAGTMISESFDLGAARSLQIISAGFGETEGGRGMQVELESKLHDLDKTPDKRPVINGPNTLGNIYRGTETLFTARYKSSGAGKGRKNCALLCQSGAYMITRISDLAGVISPDIAVSVGNQMDLSVTDFFEYMLNEDGIAAFGLYIEGLKHGDGIRLMRMIEDAHSRSQATVIYKAGRTEAGMEAARGHTAAMAGDYGMFEHLMKRAGAMVAETTKEFDDLLMLASCFDGLSALKKVPAERKAGVAALSNAGFEKCAIADHLTELAPLTAELASYSPKTRSRIEAIFGEHGITGIVDIHQVLDLSPMMNDEGFDDIIRTTLEDPNVDLGIYSFVPETVMLNVCPAGEGHKEDMLREGSLLNRLIQIRRNHNKPFVVSVESGPKYLPFRKTLLEAGIPCFASADAAARATARLIDAAKLDIS